MIVRPATVDDAYGIARVHVLTWKTTYAGIIPDSVLEKLSVERRAARLREELSKTDSDSLYFAAESEGGNVVGMAIAGANRESDLPYEGELYAIYVLEEYQGRGIGRTLFGAVVDSLVASGCTSMCLWVLSDNASKAFYEAMGGTVVGSKKMEIGGTFLDAVCYGWPNLKQEFPQ